MSVDCDELLGLRDMSLELDSLMLMAGAVRGGNECRYEQVWYVCWMANGL